MIEEYKIEDLAWKIRKIFKRYKIRYKEHPPLDFDFWIVEGAPHPSAIALNIGGKEPTNMITILLVLTKDKTGACPPIRGTEHILLAHTHFKPEPGSPFCYYHFWGKDFTLKQIPHEIEKFIGMAVEEQRKTEKEKVKAEILKRMG